MLLLLALLAQLQPLPPQLVPLDSPEGEKLLVESTARRAFFSLVGTFQTQRSQAFCGVASSAMVLNALPLEAPVDAEIAPWRLFTQDNIFGPGVAEQLTAKFVGQGGLTIEQLVLLLEGNHAAAKPTFAKASTLEAFRAEASRALGERGQFVLVDFLRSELGQDTGAHWSPLAAWHAGSDRFLVLDVARFRYPPYWVKAEDLFRAMATDDLDSGRSRGWVTVTAAAGAPPRAVMPSVRRRLIGYAALAAAVVFLIGALAGYLLGRGRGRRQAAPARLVD
jgi:Phytochelatin synthase